MSISPDVLRRLTSAVDKWRSLGATSSSQLQPIIEYDLQRITRGTQPLSKTASQAMMKAASSVKYTSRGPFTTPFATSNVPEPSRGFLGNVVGDIKDIAGGILKLPMTAVEEASKIGEVPGDITKALQAGSFSKVVNQLSQTPILRMLPGAFTAQSLTSPGGLHNLAQHPVMALLDVMPAAEKLASVAGGAALETARIAKAADRMGVEPAELTIRQAREAKAAPGALKTLIQQTAKAGEAQIAKVPALERFTPSALLDRLGVGPTIRKQSQIISVQDRLLAKDMDKMNAEIDTKVAKFFPDPARRAAISEAAQLGEPNWQARLHMTPEEVSAWDTVHDMTEVHKAKVLATRKGFVWNGELYNLEDYPGLTGHVKRYYNSLEKIDRGKLRIAKLQEEVATGNAKPVTVGRLKRDQNLIERWGREAEHWKARADALATTRPSARWKPAVYNRIRTQVETAARERFAGPELETAMKQLDAGYFERVIGPVELRRVSHDAAAGWQALQQRGVDPEFIHHVGPEAASQLAYPRTFPERLSSPTQTRKRALLMKPSIPDFAIALRHQGFEWMRVEHSAAAINKMIDSRLIKTATEVRTHYQDLSLGHTNPAQWADRAIQRDWVTFDPESLYNFRKSGIRFRGEGEMMIPRPMVHAFDLMRKGPGPVGQLLDPALGVFRLSVLALSPAYYIHNIIGDNLMLLARTGPSALKFYPEAISMLREGRVPAELARGLAEVPPDVALWQFQNGVSMAKLYSKVTGKAAPEMLTQGKSSIWKLSEFVNDSSRVVSMLYGESKAARAGLAPEAARRAGVNLASRVFQNWDTMTPLERHTIRYIMPFYGWSRYLFQYAFSYPFDHPLRVSILSNFSRNELDDSGTGLPERFAGMFFLGHPDAQGNIKGLTTGGPNPFNNLSSYFTFAGFVSHLNPITHTFMAALGVDPMTASPGMVQETQYDPATGRIIPVRPSIPRALIGDFSPQLSEFQQLAMPTQQQRDLRQNNPEAFKRQLYGAFGLRFIPTEYNIPLEVAKAEKSRMDAFENAINDLIRRGDARAAARYPELSGLIQMFGGHH